MRLICCSSSSYMTSCWIIAPLGSLAVGQRAVQNARSSPPSSHGINPAGFRSTAIGQPPPHLRTRATCAARPASARAIVAWSAYSSSPPTGSPVAIRDTRTPSGLTTRATYIAVASPSTLGLVAMMTSDRSASGAAEPADQLGDAQVVGTDALERRQQAVQHVVAAAEVPAAIDRDQVRRRRDHADRVGLAPRVAAQRARIVLGHVHADRAQPDLVGDIEQRLREIADLLAVAAHQVKREPRRGLLADARAARASSWTSRRIGSAASPMLRAVLDMPGSGPPIGRPSPPTSSPCWSRGPWSPRR